MDQSAFLSSDKPYLLFLMISLYASGRRDQQDIQRWVNWGKQVPFPKLQVRSMAMGPAHAVGPTVSTCRAMELEGATESCHISFSSAIWDYSLEPSAWPLDMSPSCSDNSSEIRNVPGVPVTYYIPNFAQWLMVPSSKWHIDCGYT